MRARILWSALAAAVLPLSAGAQTLSLTESQVLQQLAAESPRVLAIRAGIDVVRADVVAAGRWPNPRVTFNRESVAGIAENMLLFSQPLPLSGRRGLDVSAASARVAAATSRADDRVRRLRADARHAFTDVWTAQEREQELAHNRDRLQQLAEVLARREAAGDVSGFDRLRAERATLDIDVDRRTAIAQRSRAQIALVSFLTVPADPVDLEAQPPAPITRTLPGLDELVARAEQVRGDLLALRAEIDAAGFAEQSAGRQLPDPEVVGGMKSSNAGRGDVGGVFSIHVAIPLFDRHQSELVAAQSRGRQALAEAESLRRIVRVEIAMWRTEVAERRSMAERYRATVAATSDQIERIAQISYDAGERSILELLDAYGTSASARLRQVDLDAAVREAEIELEYASGWELP